MSPGQEEEKGALVAGVRLTNPDRILYPEQGVTKRELAQYYERVADWVLPHVTDRPVSLVRCPGGRQKHCFYQKNFTGSLPEAVQGVQVQEKDGQEATYILIRDLAGLVSLVQLGVLEVHPWGSRADRLERPDQLIFDLDPGPELPWAEVVWAALRVRERLSELSLESFVKTSGGKGLHVVAPLDRRTDWDEVHQFAQAVAEDIVRQEPGRYLASARKSRRKGKVFIDYLRNTRGATSVAPYSTRARPGAPVSTPLAWEELPTLTSAAAYTLANLPERLEGLREDPWQGFFDLRQSINRAMKEELDL